MFDQIVGTYSSFRFANHAELILRGSCVLDVFLVKGTSNQGCHISHMVFSVFGWSCRAQKEPSKYNLNAGQ